MFDYESVEKELDKIITATNNGYGKVDIVSINGIPFATATYGEALRPHIREDVAIEMEDNGLSIAEAVEKVKSRIKALSTQPVGDDGLDPLGYYKQNGWLVEVL